MLLEFCLSIENLILISELVSLVLTSAADFYLKFHLNCYLLLCVMSLCFYTISSLLSVRSSGNLQCLRSAFPVEGIWTCLGCFFLIAARLGGATYFTKSEILSRFAGIVTSSVASSGWTRLPQCLSRRPVFLSSAVCV